MVADARFSKETEKKRVVFLNRAYNDLDIQLSLVNEFAQDKSFHVRVIGYPADGNIGNPEAHEAFSYMKNKLNVSFQTVIDDIYAPLHLKLLHCAERNLARARKSKLGRLSISSTILKGLHVPLLILMRKLLKKPAPWLMDAAKNWNADIIFIDELYAQRGRSHLADHVLPKLHEVGASIYIIKTGQHVYNSFRPNEGETSAYTRTDAKYFFTPALLDENFGRSFFPNENFLTAGNLRMDTGWIRKLHTEVLRLPHYNDAEKIKVLPEGKIKIALMLSKLSYGVKTEELKAAIRLVGRMGNVAFVIKPHTRGMKFDFMPKSEIGHAVIVDDIPSAILCDWADLQLFTGSSIVFHAMVLGRAVGFLKFCQKQETIFDDGKSCINLEGLAELEKLITEMIAGKEALDYRAFMTHYVYAGDEAGGIAGRYKNIILEDIKAKAMAA